MKFMIVYSIEASAYQAAIKQFAETQGPPPPGVAMHGRWHAAGGHRGFVLAETSDAKTVYAWVLNWTDMVSFDVVPVLEDAEFAEAIAQHFKPE